MRRMFGCGSTSRAPLLIFSVLANEVRVTFGTVYMRHAPFPVVRADSPLLQGHVYKCPVIAGFASHRGHTMGIQCSPFDRNVLLSVGTDRELKIFSLLQFFTTVL